MENDPAHPTRPYRFSSPSITVRCGGSVELTNNSTATHTFAPEQGGFAASGNIAPGDSDSVRFFYRGAFGFMCSLHPWMKGTVRVT
ncbi:MAG: Cupredoxin-like domain [Frankiaceae bacterium]|nr:Cupredoxin-like domain [Frankiaceae bacterium]